MGRGMLTDEVKALSQKFLGYEMDTTELRLLPYLDYSLKNFSVFDSTKLSFDDVMILDKYFKKRYMTCPKDKIYVTKEFYDFIQEILWLSYVVKE